MIRSALRAVGYVVSELIPAQAIRCCLDRDYADAMYTAAAKHDGAEQLNEFEAEQDVLEPADSWFLRTPQSLALLEVERIKLAADELAAMIESSADDGSAQGPADGPPGLTHSPLESPAGIPQTSTG